MGAAEDAVAALARMGDALAAEYTRPVHAGRLEQVRQHLAGLRSLIGELPGEEEREADYEARLLDLHGAGKFNPHATSRDDYAADPASHASNYSHDARERLLHALATRGEGK